MKKTLYMLIGPKGSGKTYIGTLAGNETDISFLRVEDIWLSLNPDEDGWKKVESEIDKAFDGLNKLIIESLGAGEDFHRFHDSLHKKYEIKLIRVYADPDICLNRVINRDQQNHISVSDATVVKYNKIAAQVTLDWDIEINNNGATSDSEIIGAIKSL